MHLPFNLIVALIESQQISTGFFPMQKRFELQETSPGHKKTNASFSLTWLFAAIHGVQIVGHD